MRLLLDTHAFLWFISGDARLSSLAKEQIEEPTNRRFLSIASLWEIAIKTSIGKLELEKSGQASDVLLSAAHRRSCPQHDSQRLIDRFVRRERFRNVWIEAG